jgi:hypothetical protein
LGEKNCKKKNHHNCQIWWFKKKLIWIY